MASIKCGKCSQTHASVGEVRECFSVASADLQMAEQRADLAYFVANEPDWKQPVVRFGGRGFGRTVETIKQIGAQVPEGRYALVIAGSTSFYQVDKPNTGRWAGFVFVKVQASDETYPLKGQGAVDVLSRIAQDPQEAMLRYGREIGRCGHCGRTLTNEESRAAGIGPICRERIGFAA